MIPIAVWVAPFATLLDVVTGEDIDWVDVSCRVSRSAGIALSRGRAGLTDTATAGTLTFEMDNGDGAWTPSKSGGMSWLYSEYAATYGGVVVPPSAPTLRDMPVRVTYDVPGGQDSPLWAGVVTGVRVLWSGGMASRVQVTASDAVAHLNRIPMRQLPVQAALAYDPVACYPLDEESGEYARSVAPGKAPPLRLRTVGSAFSGATFTWNVDASPGSPGSRPGESEVGVADWSLIGANNGRALDSGASSSGAFPGVCVAFTGGAHSGTVCATILAGPEGRTRTAVSWDGPNGHRLEIGVSAVTEPYATLTGPGGIAKVVTGASVTPGQWHHVAVRLYNDLLATTIELWVDGVLADSDSAATFVTDLGCRRVRIGSSLAPWVPQCWEGRIANVAAYDAYLPDAVIEELADGVAGWTGDRTTVRGLRVAGYALRSPDLPDPTGKGYGGLDTMCPQHTAGRTCGDVLDEVATTEGSGWWTTKDGMVRVGSRQDLWGTPDVLDIPATAVDAGLDFGSDNDGRTTDLTVTRPGGARVITRTTTASNGLIYARTVDLSVDSDPQMEAYASRAMMPASSDPGPRSETVAVDVERCAASIDVDLVLGTDIGQVIEVTGLPGSAPATTMRLLVVGVSDRVDTGGWLRTFNVVPAYWYRAFWELNVSDLNTETIPAP